MKAMPSPEQRPLTPEEARRTQSAEFFIELIQRETEISDLLCERFTESRLETHGFKTGMLTPPNFGHILGKSLLSEVSVDTTVKRFDYEGRELQDVQLMIQPEDRPPLKVHVDHGITTLEYAGKVEICPHEDYRQLLEAILRGENVMLDLRDASDTQLLDTLIRTSPSVERVYIFHKEGPEVTVHIEYTESDTESDDVQLLTIELLRPHASGARVGTKITLNDTIGHSRQKFVESHTHNSPEIHVNFGTQVKEILTVEDLFSEGNNRVVPLDMLTKYHMADILDALDALERATE